MGKTQSKIRLTGKKKDGSNARLGSEVAFFSNLKDSIRAKVKKDGSLLIRTTQGKYELPKHTTQNMHIGEIDGIKVHFSHTALIGKLIYWN